MPHPPNVLFIMVDQWPGALLGSAGHPVIQTPTLDHLARLGTRYPRAYAECPICIPARRSVMTGTSPRGHGDRNFAPALPMPALPTLAQRFRDGGYQAYAVGKMHLYPQRDRIGFDDILLAEEGRAQLGAVDDYDMYLAEQGAAGEQYLHGMNNNDYLHRPWHLPERLHVTNWTTREAARMIKRRDPRRPACGMSPTPIRIRRWCRWPPTWICMGATPSTCPRAPPGNSAGTRTRTRCRPPCAASASTGPSATTPPGCAIRRAFYAVQPHRPSTARAARHPARKDCWTIPSSCSAATMATCWATSACGPSACSTKASRARAHDPGRRGRRCAPAGQVDERLVGLQDVMPTLLSLAGLPVPATVEGLPMTGERRRDILLWRMQGRPAGDPHGACDATS